MVLRESQRNKHNFCPLFCECCMHETLTYSSYGDRIALRGNSLRRLCSVRHVVPGIGIGAALLVPSCRLCFGAVLVSMVRAMYHIESMLSYLWYVWYLSYLWYVSRFRVTVLVHYAVQYFWFHQSCMFHDNSRFRADISCARLKLQCLLIRICFSQWPLDQTYFGIRSSFMLKQK